MPDGNPAAGSVLPPAPCAVGVGEVPGAVPINGLTYCVSDASTGGVDEPPPEVDVPPPEGEDGCDPPDDEEGDGALFEPPHAANIKDMAIPTAPFRIFFNMIYPVIKRYPACLAAPNFFYSAAVFKLRQ
ncbi:protein of unknown function [Paraburkholderia dioscoreae]|uniref:Uncharacterized protein n=1 Tax=Paraburkholderia dioscoreae TaxID=2604047 RepID=A0A5Q4YVD2_9BURK|nr:protein of unknown function [Paraburkholderia dioscoreae]